MNTMRPSFIRLLAISILFLIISPALSLAVQNLNLEVVDQNFSSSSRIVLNEEDIKNSQASSLPQLLSSKTNINIFGSGFQPNTIYLRGGDSRHILVLIDGIPAYDPATIQRTTNISNLNLKHIRKIEILKGSQSVLFGGQALAGVIKIETIPLMYKAQKSVSVSGQLGKFDGSANGLFPISEKWGISLGVSHADENNISPVKNSNVIYPRKLLTTDGSLIYRGDFEHILKLNYSSEQNQITDSISNTNYGALDAAGNNFNSMGFMSSYIIRNENLTFSMVQQKSEREIFRLGKDNPSPPPFDGLIDQNYTGQTERIHFDYKGFKNSESSLILGLDFSNDKLIFKNLSIVSNEEYQQFESTYIKGVHQMQNLKLEVGYRKQFSKFKNLNDSYQLGLGFNNEIKFEFSTGFNQPSLSQLYVYSANPNLLPETAQTSSLTYDKKVNENLFYSMTLFESKFDNLIFRTGSPSRNENIASAKTQGVEIETSAMSPEHQFMVSLGYTYQEPKDHRRNSWLVRRPLHIANLNLSKKLNEAMKLQFDIKKTGERTDQSGSSTYVTISENTVVDMSLNIDLNSHLNIFARINNLTNSRHELSYGYFAEGTNIRLGTNLSF